jgi:hypothetical protein
MVILVMGRFSSATGVGDGWLGIVLVGGARVGIIVMGVRVGVPVTGMFPVSQPDAINRRMNIEEIESIRCEIFMVCSYDL